jgi:AcrR family transcriptional regulator
MNPPSARRRSERSRRAVLDAAAKLLTERGYVAITIDGIAAEAKVSKTTIYRWWPAKASIFMELYAELAAQISPIADTGSLFKDLSLLMRGAFTLYRETAAGLALAGIIAEAQSNPALSQIVRNDFSPSRRRIILTVLERAAARGEIPGSVDIETLSEIVAGASWYCLLVGSGQLTDRHAVRIVETIFAGLLGIADDGAPVRRGAAPRTSAARRKGSDAQPRRRGRVRAEQD